MIIFKDMYYHESERFCICVININNHSYTAEKSSYNARPLDESLLVHKQYTLVAVRKSYCLIIKDLVNFCYIC